MPWHPSSPDADHRHVQSRMLRSIAAAILPVLTITASYGANTRFTPIATYPSGGKAQYTATADVNGDGKQDVFASNLNGVVSQSLLGNGNGSFQPAKTIVALSGGGSYPILTADFNRDGKPDLAVLQPAKTRVLIYLGRGDGTFQAVQAVLCWRRSEVHGGRGCEPGRNHLGSDRQRTDPYQKAILGFTVGFTFLLGDGTGSFHPPVTVTATERSRRRRGYRRRSEQRRRSRRSLRAVREVRRKSFSGMELEPFASSLHSTMARVKDGESQLLLADLHGTGKLDLVVGYYGFEGNPGGVNPVFRKR